MQLKENIQTARMFCFFHPPGVCHVSAAFYSRQLPVEMKKNLYVVPLDARDAFMFCVVFFVFCF